MAILKTILHKKNSSGSYDDVYVRTRTDNVLMTDNSTLLSTKLSTMDTTIAGKAASSHTHSGYASSSHNHSGVYAPISHTHTTSEITGLGSSSIKIAKINVTKSNMTTSNINTYIWSASSLGTAYAYLVCTYTTSMALEYSDEEDNYYDQGIHLGIRISTIARFDWYSSGFVYAYNNYTDEGCLSICAKSAGGDWAGIGFTKSGLYCFGYNGSRDKFYPKNVNIDFFVIYE